jgi:glycosyltransferase involved in cell wall biosynthesis
VRIAVVNWSRRKVGGVESYLGTIIPALAQSGHEVAFWCEVDEPSDRARIELPEGMASWCVAEVGVGQALEGLRAWRPDVIFAHKFADPDLEADVQRLAPSVFFAHDYYGTCISGQKTFRYPSTNPCQRRFSAACLLHYFPRRCGGRSPLTMLKLYGLQTRRMELLHRYDAIATHSEHMLRELLRHGLAAHRVHNFPYYVKPAAGREPVATAPGPSGGDCLPPSPVKPERWHLLFAGRMELLKGGHVLLESLPRVVAELDQPVRVTLAGDGRERQRLEEMARRLRGKYPALEIVFTGWLSHEQMGALLGQCDLLVVPSLWPEPFGLVGPEAGMHGVPVAAFAVGGIPDWLREGVNGALAPGERPDAAGLAAAILRCLESPAHHARLCQGAVRIAEQFNVNAHLESLVVVLEKAIEHKHRGAQKTVATVG